jgi:hypothetical protein
VYDFEKLSDERIRTQAEGAIRCAGGDVERAIQTLQLVVFTMAGGGWLGESASVQPGGFYVDGRVSRRPYQVRAIKQATRVLAEVARIGGYDPETGVGRHGKEMPRRPDFPNLGVF